MRNEIGRSIAMFRKKKGYTPGQLAIIAEISLPVLRTIESGKCAPTIEEVERIANALRERPERIIGWRREGGGIITWWEELEDGKALHVEWEKPFRMVFNESYPCEGAAKLVFEEEIDE
ncbi:MAG: helix-turn-helix transcriptional regulator [Lachnospiraceae bacterium]|nr:helix-turn-helix transcriptional regulator [Lachnospiraceae bacterium]